VSAVTEAEIEELDKSVEIAALIRASEAGYARDYRKGVAFGHAADRRRLDAFTLGLLDALAHRIGVRHETIKLLAYVHTLLEHGPGQIARTSFREFMALGTTPVLARYVAGGRHHILRVLSGNPPQVGRFAELLTEELGDS
jgi:hypothetical protein